MVNFSLWSVNIKKDFFQQRLIVRIFNTIFIAIGIFFASFLIPVIGAVVSIPMSLIGAYLYYNYDKN